MMTARRNSGNYEDYLAAVTGSSGEGGGASQEGDDSWRQGGISISGKEEVATAEVTRRRW